MTPVLLPRSGNREWDGATELQRPHNARSQNDGEGAARCPLTRDEEDWKAFAQTNGTSPSSRLSRTSRASRATLRRMLSHEREGHGPAITPTARRGQLMAG
jgi:hypothetical protein